MNEQEIKSPDLTPKHLALTKTSSVYSVTETANAIYHLNINENEFENRYAFYEEGLLTLHFVSIETGELVWVFQDRYSSIDSDIDSIENPKNFLFKKVTENFGILINSEKELSFLKDVKLDIRYDEPETGNDKAYRLMLLLNNYGFGDGWSCNSDANATTCRFILRYIGEGKNAPSVYNFNPDSSYLVVVELLVNNVYQTYALTVR